MQWNGVKNKFLTQPTDCQINTHSEELYRRVMTNVSKPDGTHVPMLQFALMQKYPTAVFWGVRVPLPHSWKLDLREFAMISYQ
jgi:hypothetical protein